MDPREFLSLPEEFAAPPPEFGDLADEYPPVKDAPDASGEFAALPDEFYQGSGPQTPQKSGRRRVKWLYYTAAVFACLFITGFGLFSGSGDAIPQPGVEVTPVISDANGAAEDPVSGSTADGPEVLPPEPAEPEPEPAPSWPLGTGTIVLTVYNNTFSFDAADDPDFPYIKVLMHETFADEEFSAISLPEAIDDNEGWDPAGYILHYNAEFDYGYEPSSETGEFVRVINGGILTADDVEAVPPDANGTRYVNIHVMWLPLFNDEPKMRLELDLNDGSGEVEAWEADQPFASEGFTYLAVFGEPGRDGYTFTGWFDSEGNKVDFISYYDFFPLLPGAQSREDRDWQNPQAIRLTAGWGKN